MNMNELCIHRVSKFGDPLTLKVVITKYALICSYAVRRVRKFLVLMNKVEISPLGQRGIRINMNVLIFFIRKSTQLPFGHFPTIGANCGIHVFTHNGEEIFENTYRHLCGVLNIVPQNPTLNAMVCKRIVTMSASENHIIKKKIKLCSYSIS